MKPSAFFIAFLLTALAATAATQIDRWSVAGGAWDHTYQTDWVTSNIIKPDASADSGASLHVSARPAASGLAPTGGLYGEFYYTFFTAPALTLSTDNVLADLTTITLDFAYASTGPTSIGDIGLTLNFNAANTALAADTFSVGSSETIGTVIGNQTFTNYSFTWSVIGLGASDALSFTWALQNHDSFSGIALTQSSAVPEPAAFAALAGLGVLALAALRRRRAA